MPDSVQFAPFTSDFEMEYKEYTLVDHTHPHVHNAVEIYLALSSIPFVLLGNRILSVPENTLLVFPPYCAHQFVGKPGILYRRYVMNINSSWLDMLLEYDRQYEYLKRNASPAIALLNPESAALLSSQMHKLIFPEPLHGFERLQYFLETMNLTDQMIREHGKKDDFLFSAMCTGSAQNAVNQMLSYIAEHLDEPITIKQLSDFCYLSPDYLSRIFKRYTHTTIGNYIVLQKTAKACRLLQQGHSITQVQQLTGYSSYAHFFRTFKKQMGVTPGEYRRSPHQPG